jgi:shikimate kinase
MTLILCGFPFSGKSFFGELVAKELDLPFIDTDLVLEKMYFEKKGETLSCRQIFHKEGEAFFRDLEHRAVDTLPKNERYVVALGGGTLENKPTCVILKNLGTVVYIKASKELLLQRITETGEVPAYLDPNDLSHSFERLYEKRSRVYEENAHFIVVPETCSLETTIESLCFLISPGGETYGE